MNDLHFRELLDALLRDGSSAAPVASLIAEQFLGRALGISRTSSTNSNVKNVLPSSQIPSIQGGGITSVFQGLPLTGLILRQFTGRETPAETYQPVRYTGPDPIQLDSTLTTPGSPSGGGRVADESAAAANRTPTVVINVSAMDSRSILDRSDDIASAVRQAMLTYQPFDDIWR